MSRDASHSSGASCGLSHNGSGVGEPRHLTPLPPDAVGSLAPEWVAWFEGSEGPGVKLRPWQRLVLDRALAVDAAGRLVFRDVIVSTPRQSGKGWLAFALAIMRCQFAGRFDGPQTVLHVANRVETARRIQERAWRWAASRGLSVRKMPGTERVAWPDDSSWVLSSAKSVWGASASVAIADECWDLESGVITSALWPTLVERDQSQLWLTSTANERSTSLMPDFRVRALDGAPRMMIAEWSADPDDDPADPDLWQRISPHWSDHRAELMRAAVGSPGFAYQWLNVWPTSGREMGGNELLLAVDAWEGCRVSGLRPPGRDAVRVAAVEDDFGRGGAVALGWMDGERMCVWAACLPMPDCWLQAAVAPMVLCGLSLRDVPQARACGARPVDAANVNVGLSALRRLIDDGGLAWDGDERFALEGGKARVQSDGANRLRLRVGQGLTGLRAALFVIGELAGSPIPQVWVIG